MRIHALIATIATLALGLCIAQCGPSTSNFSDSGTDKDSGENGDSTLPFNDGGNPFGSDGNVEAAPPCQGLQCQVVSCGGGGHTTVSGTVYDPAGNNPLYNILVYIPIFPNAPLPAITHGMSCDTCAAKIDNAMATALTDSKGHFVIKDAPVGTNIPLVVQVGKWRRSYTLPATTACVDTAYPSSTTPANRMRLPAKQSEGSMPLIAFSTGCDPMEDLIKKVGIAATEFTNPSGTGMVRVYQAKYPNTAGVTSPGDAYAFWDNATEMQKYDILINACECSPYHRDKGYANLDTFLNGGGRFFGSHFHINFFTGEQLSGAADAVPADMSSAASFSPTWGSCMSGPFDIDTTFPKGKAMADWMQNLFPTAPYAQMALSSSGCMVKDINGTTPNISQQWIYDSASKAPGYISINTPTSKQPQDRCGRAVLTDLHVGTTSATLEQQEAALEFMFFDLAACVQDDGTTPTPPTPN